MQIVIDIPDYFIANEQKDVDLKIHCFHKEIATVLCYTENRVEKWLSYKVLPKGHGKFIAEDELRKYIIHENCDDGCGYIDERDIANIPAVIEANEEVYRK